MNELDFYNRQHQNHGRYDHADNSEKTLNLSHPEDYFEHLVKSLSSPEKTLVDLGCGDGLFTSQFARLNRMVIGVEPSNLIEAAIEQAQVHRMENLILLNEFAESLSLETDSVDIVISRRGPNPVKEIARVLKKGGYFVFITIGEQDCRDLKSIVGRGQHYDKTTRVKDDLTLEFEEHGFEVIECNDYLYDQPYNSNDQLIDFLGRVPIFEDFGESDYPKVSEFTSQFNGSEIVLSRHRVVFVGKLI